MSHFIVLREKFALSYDAAFRQNYLTTCFVFTQ